MMQILMFCAILNIGCAAEVEIDPCRSSNQITIDVYEQCIQEYVLGTSAEYSAAFDVWIDDTLEHVSPRARIIEIGSGFGRDAVYIESKGFVVERTDATKGFVALLQEKGFSAQEFNVITDPFPATYDLVFANRVFLHFTPQELQLVLDKIKRNLRKEGILAFSLKQGEGEEWSRERLEMPRYYYYWREPRIRALLESSGFGVILVYKDSKFLQIIAKAKQ